MIVRTGPDGTLHLTCPELPQLSVSSPTVTEAISRTEDRSTPSWPGVSLASRTQAQGSMSLVIPGAQILVAACVASCSTVCLDGGTP